MARRAAFDSGRFERTLRRLMADFLREHRAIGEDLIETIIRYMSCGVSVHRAIDEALNSSAYDRRVTEAVAQAAYLAACDGFGALPTMVANAGGVRGKLLAESWTSDGMRLSERLHRPALRNTIVRAVSEGMSRADDARETALRLYDGYGKGGAIDRQAVAKDIDALRRQALQAVGGDGLKALRDRARAVKGRVDGLTTSGLRVAYKNLIRACMAPELKAAAIERAARVAVEEKTRYVAERIARTEAARAWFDGFLAETADDPDIWGYKWVLSSGHRLLGYVDECDVAARADVGYGPGVYPKERCPGIPLHPHCMCSLVPVAADDSEAQSRPMNPGGARRYIDGLTERGRRQLFGVDGARAYRDGAEWTALLRGWPGFRTPISRLTAADFQTLNGVSFKFDLQLFATGDKLPEGEYNLTVRRQVQSRHIEGTKERAAYIENRRRNGQDTTPSYLLADVDPQALVKQYHGKGAYKPNNDGTVREEVKADRVVGRSWDNKTGGYIDTRWFAIVYSKRGTHVYPIYPRDKDGVAP